MWSVLIVGLLAGLIGANGVPHFVKGITGQKHQTLFGKPSSAAVNVVWGWANLAVAVIIWHLASMHVHPRAAFVAAAAGALITGLILADNWTKHPEHNR